MDTTETTRLRALCERAALPACEARLLCDDGAWCVVVPQGESFCAIIAELSWSGVEPFGGEDVTKARAQLYAEAPVAIPALCDAIEARDREIAETQRRTAELEAALIEARGERDDLRAIVETRNAELGLRDELLTAERQRAEAAEARAVRAVAAEREACAALRARVEALEESAAMACVDPRAGCDCAGCLYARAKGGDHEHE